MSVSNIGKRRIDPGVWEEPFFSMLNTEHRLLYFYINMRCHPCGIIQLNYPVDSAYLGFKIDEKYIDLFIEAFNTGKKRLTLYPGQLLFLHGFIRDQQISPKRPFLSIRCNPHVSIVNKLKELNIFEQYVKEDPELFAEFLYGRPEGIKNPTNKQLKSHFEKGRRNLKQGYVKGYSNSSTNSSGNSFSSSEELFKEAENIYQVCPFKEKKCL